MKSKVVGKSHICHQNKDCTKTEILSKPYILNIHILIILFTKACANLITVTRIFPH